MTSRHLSVSRRGSRPRSHRRRINRSGALCRIACRSRHRASLSVAGRWLGTEVSLHLRRVGSPAWPRRQEPGEQIQ